MKINLGSLHADRELLFQLHALDEVDGDAGQADEPVHCKRRAGGHAKRGEYLRVLSHEGGLDVRNVVGRTKRRLNVLGSLDAGGAEGLWRESHKPVVVHIDGLNDVRLPLLGLVAVNGPSWLRLHTASWFYRARVGARSLRAKKVISTA